MYVCMIGFLVLCFPVISSHSPCFHFCPFHVPFSSPLFPFHFPLLSCHVDFLFPPLISLHFLAFPLCSPVFPAKNTGFSKNTEFFSYFRQKEAGSLSQQKRKTTFSGTSSKCRAVRANPPPTMPPKPTYLTLGGAGVRGGLSSIL